MIVVTGATGNVGRPLVHALHSAGEEITAVARTVSADNVPAGVRRVAADLTEPESLRPALTGASELFLLTPGEFTTGSDVLKIARDCGVRRVVLLSSRGVGTGRHPAAAEDAVRASGLEWTVLRPGGFHSNAFGWAETIRTRRVAAAPFGDVATPGIDPADIADVADVVLRDPGHDDRTYELTGPEPITPRQQVAAIATALGHTVEFIDLTREQAETEMLRMMPAGVVGPTLDLLGDPTPEEQRVWPTVERLLGRPPRSFAEWAARHIAAFR